MDAEAEAVDVDFLHMYMYKYSEQEHNLIGVRSHFSHAKNTWHHSSMRYVPLNHSHCASHSRVQPHCRVEPNPGASDNK